MVATRGSAPEASCLAQVAPSGPRAVRTATIFSCAPPNRSVTRVASAAPMSETPTVPPRLRKKVTPELATPISDGFAVFCTARTRFCIVMPTPAPSRNM